MRGRLCAAGAPVAGFIVGWALTWATALPAAEVDMVLSKPLSERHLSRPARYTVQPGDSVSRILRRFGLSGKMSGAYRRSLESANPWLKDLNLIQPGQVLTIPPETSFAGSASAADAGAAGRAAAESPTPKAEPASPSGLSLPGTTRLAAEAFSGLGEATQEKGTLHFPIGNLGTLRLESDRFPLVSLGNGTVLILDPLDSISPSVKALVESTWPRYRLVPLNEARTPEEALDRILRESNYYSVARSKELVLGGDVRVRLNCDWLVEKTADSLLDGSVYAVNYARHPREVIPQAIREYASRYNIQVVNLPESMDRSFAYDVAPASRTAVESLEGRSQTELVDRLLTRLGLPFLADVELTLYEEKSGGAGLTFRADRVVEGSRRLLVSFRDVPPALKNLMDAQDVDHVSLGAGLSAEETITSLLAALRLGFTAPRVRFTPPGENGKDKFTISVPGVFVRAYGENLLLTRTAPDPQILAFLAARGVTVLRY